MCAASRRTTILDQRTLGNLHSLLFRAALCKARNTLGFSLFPYDVWFSTQRSKGMKGEVRSDDGEYWDSAAQEQDFF